MSIKVFSVAEMVAAERAADASGVSYDAMMETAGRRVAEAIIARMAITGKSVLILVGPGNNGGDGLVAGRYLAQAGADVAFYLYKSRDPEKDSNYRLVQEMGLFIVEAEHDQRYRVLQTRLNVTDILVDALLGTGVTRPIEGNLAHLMKQVKTTVSERDRRLAKLNPLTTIDDLVESSFDGDIENSDMFRVAVDCPSGLNCDTGALDRFSIPADLTITFAGPKRGHFRFPGAAACGELVVADINISAALPEVSSVPLTLVTPLTARTLLPERPRQGHKGTFGTTVIASGSEHYWGAPVLAARGAYRAGAGLVALVVPEVIRSTVAGQVPEATYPPVTASNILDSESVEFILSGISGYQSLLVGPGLGPADSFVAGLLAVGETMPPLIVDADGLNILATRSDWQRKLPANTILTPHPGEMARLLNRPPAEVKTVDRVELARQSAQDWGHIVLLKGAYSIVAAPDGQCALIPFANPLLAVGGSGDVLAGMIAAYLAQGLGPYESAVLGAYMHGAAGQLAAESFGDAGVLAGELADWVPAVRNRIISM